MPTERPRSRKHRRPAPAGAAVPSRSERKNQAARDALVPLREGERPTAVTVAAVVAFLLAAGNLIAFAVGLKVDGQRAPIGTVAFQALLMLTAAWGMWHVRYWAVLGMEAILAILIVLLAVLLFKASTVVTALILLAVIVPAGALFWTLVKAMARIQMPERPR
jgi:hypothetical protein